MINSYQVELEHLFKLAMKKGATCSFVYGIIFIRLKCKSRMWLKLHALIFFELKCY